MARQQGLSEAEASKVDDDFESSNLAERHKAALRMTDAFLKHPAGGGAACAELARFFNPGQVVELTLALAMFLGMSKVLIALGLEPDDMPTTVVATPGS